MALEKAQRGDNAISFKFVKKGDTITGYYVGTKEVPINGQNVKRHLFVTATGLLSVLGQFDMYKQLEDNNCLNTNVVITFTGDIQKLKGGRTMKLYDVSFDRSDTYDSGKETSLEPEEADAFEEESDTEEDEIAADEVILARPPRTAKAAAVPTAADQARVKALLGRK